MSAKLLGTLRNCAKLTFDSLKQQNHRAFPQIASFTTSKPLQLREIVKEEKDGTIVIKGKVVDSPKAKNLVKLPADQSKACPICRLNLDIRYTDVLILAQFLQEDGEILPREVTGVCLKSQNKLEKLITQAHTAGLLPTFQFDERKPPELRSTYKWRKFPAYYKDVY